MRHDLGENMDGLIERGASGPWLIFFGGGLISRRSCLFESTLVNLVRENCGRRQRYSQNFVGWKINIEMLLNPDKKHRQKIDLAWTRFAQ